MFRGEDIFFRVITPDDLDLVYAWENNPENWKISCTTEPFSRQQIEQFVNLDQDIFVHEQLRLILCLTSTNEVVGNIDLFEFEPLHKRVGVGILIDEKYRGKGYGRKALILVDEYCKLILGVQTLFCNILTDNSPSINLFESCGYQRVGVRKKWHFYDGEWFDQLLYQKEI